MSIISASRTETAIWWQATGKDEWGAPTFASPVEIECKWIQQRRRYVSQQGDDVVSDATVMVDRDVANGDYLQLGELDSTTPDSPIGEDDAYPVRDVYSILAPWGERYREARL